MRQINSRWKRAKMGLEASQSCGLTVDEDLADPAEEASRRQVEQHCCSPLTQPLCQREMCFLFSRLINCKASLTRLIRWYIAGRGARGSSPQTQACVATWVPALMSSAWPPLCDDQNCSTQAQQNSSVQG